MLEQKSTKQAGLREKPTARSSLPSLVSRLDIVEIISEFIKVERRGKRLMALCPFHEDKDPSLQIDQERQLFYCFPCQKGGNLVTFLQRFNSWSVAKVRTWIIERLGLIDPGFNSKGAQNRRESTKYTPFQQEIINFNRRFESTLQLLLLERQGNDYRLQRFLKARGLSFEDLASFKLGYLPQDSLTILEQRGFNKEELITFGHYNNLRASFFLPRLVFPIRRDPEDVVGFVFRSIDLEGNQAQAKQQLVRYINSNEDALFKKRENLYNLDRINQQANGESVFVVEGIFDVIALTKVGQRNTVALLGLNLSDEQIELLRGYELVLALDNDDAGRDSSLKIAIKLLENEIPFKILRPAVDLPKDWDQWLRERGRDSLLKHLRDQLSISDYLYRSFTIFEPSSPSDFSDIMARLREFLPFINPLEAQWLSSRFANHFSIDRSLIEDNLSIKQEANLNSGLIVESQNQTKRPLRSRRRIRMKTTFRPRQEIKSLLPSGSEGLWEDKLFHWEKRILRSLLSSAELRDYFKENYQAKECFQGKLSLSFWEEMIEKEEVDRSLISPELIELEAEIAQIKDFPDSPSRLAELIDNLNLPVAHHLTKRRRG